MTMVDISPYGWLIVVNSGIVLITLWLFVTVRHGKIHHAIKNGKPSISIRAMASMAM